MHQAKPSLLEVTNCFLRSCAEPLYAAAPDGTHPPPSVLEYLQMKLRLARQSNMTQPTLEKVLRQDADELLPQPNNAPGSLYQIKKLLSRFGAGVGSRAIPECRQRDCLFLHNGSALIPVVFIKRRLHHQHCAVCTTSIHALINAGNAGGADGARMAERLAAYPDFFRDPRNIVLGFQQYGFNPWSETQYSITPLLLINYNLPDEVRSCVIVLESDHGSLCSFVRAFSTASS